VLRQRLGPLVPLPFILRDLGLGARITWPKLLAAFLGQPFAGRWKRAKPLLQRLLKDGQCVLLFDGIDELGSVAVRQALRTAIWQAMDLFPRCRFLLTSRVVGYDEVGMDYVPRSPAEPKMADVLVEGKIEWMTILGRQLFSRTHIAPFTDDQIEDFATHWWRVHRGGRSKADKDVRDFLAALRGSPGVRTLARIPNLLTLIALVYKTFVQLPDGRADLYQRIAQAYLENIDRHYGLPLPFAHQEMARWLGAIAWRLQLRRSERATKGKETTAPDLFASKQEVLGWLRTAIRPQHGARAGEIASAFLHFVERRSGLFLPRGEDRYGFLHLSFLEYFAALHLREAIGSEDWWESHAHHGPRWPDAETNLRALRRYASQRLWRETFIFLFELLALQNARLPTRRLRLLLTDDPSTSDWPELRAPFPLEEKPQYPPEQTTVATVELVAALSVNPHLPFSEADRRGLWRRCWDWELARQTRESIWRELTIPPLLTSRAACLKEVLTELATRSLTKLSLADCPGLTDLTPLAKLSDLQALHLSGCTSLSDLAPLAQLSDLQALHLSGCTSLSDLVPLAQLSDLQALHFDGCTSLSDLVPLAQLSDLQTLGLNGCTRLGDLAPLAGLSELRTLQLYGCTGLRDVTPLAKLSSLKLVDLRGCTGLTEASLRVIKNLKARRVRVLEP
jgi:internalin A